MLSVRDVRLFTADVTGRPCSRHRSPLRKMAAAAASAELYPNFRDAKRLEFSGNNKKYLRIFLATFILISCQYLVSLLAVFDILGY